MAATRMPIRNRAKAFDPGFTPDSARAIAQDCRLSVSKVSGHLGPIAVAKVPWPLPSTLDDYAALTRPLFPSEGSPSHTHPCRWPFFLVAGVHDLRMGNAFAVSVMARTTRYA